MQELDSYAIALKQRASAQISEILTAATTGDLAKRTFRYHAESARSLRFQQYYFETVGRREAFLESPRFFAAFKTRYSLLGIDGGYLAHLEERKGLLLRRIEDGDLAGVYLDYFAAAQIRHAGRTVSRNLGSFFAKLVHTLRPTEYCALDNPVKDYFGYKTEGFFIAFVVLSAVYREWAMEHASRMAEVRQAFASNRKLSALGSGVTDLKLLDLVFWRLANEQQGTRRTPRRKE